jgi:GMP synthase (glutamine-hydrolysing)
MISVIDFGSSKTVNIADTLRRLGFACNVIKWNEFEKINLENTKALILSGAPILITETDISTYIKKFEFLKETDVPVLGICFGHQLLGIIHGSEIFKGEPIRTKTEIFIDQQDELFLGFDKIVVMTEDHTEGITLPENFIRLASSDKYDLEAMKHKTKPVYGVQFHPEVSGENGMKLLTNFCRLL